MRILATLLLVSLSGNCFAHRDTTLSVEPDGSLRGLPVQFSPASLTLEFGRIEGSNNLESVTLEISGNSVKFPICIVRRLRSTSAEEIHVTSSWYHDQKIVPHYLGIDFHDSGFDSAKHYNQGYKFLFNVNTLRLMSLEVSIVERDERSVQVVPVGIRSICTDKELEGFLEDSFR